MDVSKNRGGPPKWMVYNVENPIKMDDLVVPLFLETSTAGLWSPTHASHQLACAARKLKVMPIRKGSIPSLPLRLVHL